jgi:hypothetical protein
MINLPPTTDTPLVRTDYSDDSTWLKLVETVRTPSADGFLASVQIVEDPNLAGAAAGELASNYAKQHALLIVADNRTMNDPDHPFLCVDLESARSLRVVPAELWSIENNLSLRNMDFDEFVDSADEGIFRGFS